VKVHRVWRGDNGLFRTVRRRKYQCKQLFVSGRTIAEHNKDRWSQREGREVNSKVNKLKSACPLF
jgi:hypothetical protein